jgi:YVTN family beta-propeller protein
MRPSLRLVVGALVVTGLAAAILIPRPEAACAQAGRPSVARTATGGPRLRLVTRVRTGIQPKSVDLSPDGQRVYVCNFGRPDRDNVKVYDAETLDLLGTIEFEGNAVETAFSPDGSTVYVSNFRRDVIEVVDAATFEVRAEVAVDADPKVMTLSPDGSRLYVANWSSDTITEIDTARLEVVGTRRTGRHPRGMAMLSSGRFFAAAMYSHVVHVFDPDRADETGQFGPCRYPRHLLLSPEEDRLYTSCSCCRQVRWFDPATQQLQGIAATGQNPRTIALTADGRWLTAAGFDDSSVTLIDTANLTHRVVPVPGADQIVGVAIRGGDVPRIYATSWLTGELVVLETRSP